MKTPLHVIPNDDLFEHKAEGDKCFCRPTTQVEYNPDDPDAMGTPVIVHRSFDQRELTEESEA